MSIINIINDEQNSLITLEEIKNFLRIDFNDDDNLLTNALKTALRQCELATLRTITKKTYQYSFYDYIKSTIELKFPPIISVETIETINENNISTTINLDTYVVDLISNTVKFKNTPTNFYRVDITYKAGYTTIPEDLKQAILFHIAKIYEDKYGYSPVPKASSNIYKNYRQIKL